MGSAGPRFHSRAALFAIALVVPAFFRPPAFTKATVVNQAEGHLKISGTRFLNPDGSVFQWRGITAFRLLEFVAHGREADADAYLKWAASRKLTVVRVLAMADGIFQLSPADGERALPRLLDARQTSWDPRRGGRAYRDSGHQGGHIAIVTAIGAICARYPNALLELANEPGHPTQSAQSTIPFTCGRW